MNGKAQPLDHHGHALAPANTHGLHAELLVGVLQAIEKGGHDAGAGHAERVAEGDGPAVHIQLVEVDPDLVGRRQNLSGESFVDLEQVDVVWGHTGPAEGLADGLDGPEAHDLRVQG
ncbi:MAG: hypothetical protein Ct9H300mP31_15970 [Acidimicrobiaceae bacterium]|nr:MAG: hypothetical protein Ct9H300mP31_15970 [Acidimicrobiaceae bacterium]